MKRFIILSLILIGYSLASATSARALDCVTFQRKGRALQVEGQLLVTAEDGGLLILARDGVLWAIPPEEQVEHTRDAVPYRPFTAKEMTDRLLAQLPAGFEVHKTAHYLIFHDTSKSYATWCGSLFEGLHRAFTNYWSNKGFRLTQSKAPLVAIVFAEAADYQAFSKSELGAAGNAIIGHFSLRTNRMQMYDLTGVEAYRRNTGGGARVPISRILAMPEAQRQVATIIHEATHQIAFNCGMHTRYSDCPVWFSEGIAVYFETPDLSSTRGWRRIGEVNEARLTQFRQYARTRPANSLATLVVDDKRFHNTSTSLDAYAETWALSYFLIRMHPKEYLSYLRVLSVKKPLLQDGPDARLKEFESAFGDLDELDAEFLRYMATRVK